MRSGSCLYIYSADMAHLLTAHEVTWSHYDSFCPNQFAFPEQPEEFPSMPVKTVIRQLPQPPADLSFEKFNFTRRMTRMTNSLFEAVVHATRVLTKYGLTVEELAAVVEQNDMSDAEVLAVSKVFDCLLTKQEISTVNFMLRTSRLPMKVPKTFDNFDFSRITGKNVERLRSLPTLSALYARKNPCLYWPTRYGQDPLSSGFWACLL